MVGSTDRCDTNENQKYWVMKQEDRYYNCFILYAKNLHLSVDFDDDWLMDCYHPSVLVGNYWEWIEVEERYG